MRIGAIGLILGCLMLIASAQFERDWYAYYELPGNRVDSLPCKVVYHPNVGYYVVARARVEFAPFYAYWLTQVLRYDAHGTLLWQRTHADWGIVENLTPVDAVCTVEGNLVIGCDLLLRDGSYDTALLAVSPEGNLLWYQRYRSTPSEQVSVVAISPQGNIYVGRTTTTIGAALLCYSPNGTLLWQSSPNTMDVVRSISFAPDGTAFVAGAYPYYGSYRRSTVVAFNPSGTVLWEYRTTLERALSPILYDPNTNSVHVVSLGTNDSLYFRFDRNGNLLVTLPFGGLESGYPYDTPYAEYLLPFDSNRILVGRSRANRIYLISSTDGIQGVPSFTFNYSSISLAPNHQWVFSTLRDVRALEGRFWTQHWVWTIPFNNSIPWSITTTPEGKSGVLLRIQSDPTDYPRNSVAFGILSPSGTQLALHRIDNLNAGWDIPTKAIAHQDSLYLLVQGLGTGGLVRYGAEPQPLWEIQRAGLRDFIIDPSGAIYIATEQNANTAVISKFTLEGQHVWSTTVSMSAQRQKLILSPSGDVIVLGESGSSSSLTGHIVRLSPSGDILYNEAFPSNKSARLATFAPDGQFYVILDDETSSSGFDLRVYDTNFQLVRSVPFVSSEDSRYTFGFRDTNLTVTEDAVFIVTWVWNTRYDLVKLDRAGNLIFRRAINFAQNVRPPGSFVVRDSQGRYYLSTYIPGGRILTCFDETATVLWNYTQANTWFTDAIVRERSNQLIVSAEIRRNSGPDFVSSPWIERRLLVLNLNDGSLLFEQDDTPSEVLNMYYTGLASTRNLLWTRAAGLRLGTGMDVLVGRYRLDTQSGDVNGDGCVDDADLLAVLFAFGSQGSQLPEDLNEDGVVDDADLLEVLFQFGTGC